LKAVKTFFDRIRHLTRNKIQNMCVSLHFAFHAFVNGIVTVKVY